MYRGGLADGHGVFKSATINTSINRRYATEILVSYRLPWVETHGYRRSVAMRRGYRHGGDIHCSNDD
jgi:hypothetical protein